MKKITHKTLTRRDFLKTAGITLAASTLTCSGLGYVATRPPAIDAPEHQLTKDSSMKDRILITYATRAGSTVEIAAAIGETLHQHSYAVDVKPVKENPSLTGYQAVILGSAIRMGTWLPEAVKFIETNRQALLSMPVALFTVHMLNTGKDENSRVNRLAYLDKVRPLLNIPEEVYFAGVMDYSKLSFLDRTIAKMVKSGEGDSRDWQAIRAWVPEIISIPQ
jgi:menaquinone-dependent protoporphyrinogen oxidase